MVKNKDITPRNSKNKAHGYWEKYKENGSLWYKGSYNNGNSVGLWEWYYSCNINWDKQYYNYKGNVEGIGIDG